MLKPEIEDLQCEIYQIKKQQLETKSENHLLKVKLRKLQDEIIKKNRQLDNLLDPKKALNVRKLISQHGATLICSLREENFILRKQLAEKDFLVKRLNSDLQTAKLYVTAKSKIVSPSMKLVEAEEVLQQLYNLSESNNSEIDQQIKVTYKPRSKSVANSFKRSLSSSPERKGSKSATNLHDNYISMINNNLQKIRQLGKASQTSQSYDTGQLSPTTPQKELTSQNDTPHEEIQQLQNYFLNVVNEVDTLKNTLYQLQKEQIKTSIVLKNKNTNIEKLASQLESLKSNQEKSNDVQNIKHNVKNECNESNNPSTKNYDENVTSISSQNNSSSKQPLRLDFNKTSLLKTIGIQTTKSFCSHVFTSKDPLDSKVNSKNTKIETDENGIEVEYID